MDEGDLFRMRNSLFKPSAPLAPVFHLQLDAKMPHAALTILNRTDLTAAAQPRTTMIPLHTSMSAI
jgi:hypothetical protein